MADEDRTHETHLSLPSLRGALSKQVPTLTLDVKVTNYIGGQLSKEDSRTIRGAFLQFVQTEIEKDGGQEKGRSEALEKMLRSEFLKEMGEKDDEYHVTLLFPSEGLVRRAAEFTKVDVGTDYAELSKKKRAQKHGEVMRSLKEKEGGVEVIFGDNAILTRDGELAAIEVLVPETSVYRRVDPDKVFHVTLAHNRDVEGREPAASNEFLRLNAERSA